MWITFPKTNNLQYNISISDDIIINKKYMKVTTGEWDGERIWQEVPAEPITETIAELKERMEQIAGEWDGDLPGEKEDRAEIALDVITKLDEVEELLSELN